MFGDLFNAADENVDCDLPEKRDVTGLCGIKNQGATCYLNSLLQTLFFTPEFRTRLFALNKEELGFQHYNSEAEAQNKVRKIPLQLQLLFARLLHIDQNACDTENLTKSFGWVDKEHFQQHDVQELSRILFDAINDSLRGTSDQNLVNDLYKGTLKNRIVCDTCKNETVNMEDFLDLTIAVSSRRNISNSLKDMYVSEELMTDKNQYYCSKCSCLRDAKKDSKIKVLPDILTFSLLRFNFDYTTLKRYKENGEFVFPLCLNMAPYVVESTEMELNEYELYSVIIHKGNAFGGHYHAYIRDYDGLGTVPNNYSFHQSKKNNHTPIHSGDASSSAVMNPSEVIAYIVAKLGGEDVPLLKISESLMQECGTSWNKQYRKTYGTMLKYIQSQPELFLYNKKSQSITLKSFENVLLDNQKFAENLFSEDPLTCANEVNETNYSVSNDEKVIWFDFNDSKIQPITMAEIERQYQGRESAYMLFYRRKKLGKVDETSENKTSCPPHLKEIIDNENAAMEQYRIERELKKNHININLYLSDMFKQSGGLIVLKEETIEPISISFSKDGNTAQLKNKIKETLTEHHSSSPNADEDIFVSELKILSHKGIHVYESLEIDKNLTINESKFFNNIKVIVWNGKQIADIEIQSGEEYEPVVISVQYTHPNDDSSMKMLCNCVMSSHLSITDVHKNVGKFYQLNSTDLNASILNEKEESRIVDENEVTKSITKVLQESETLCLSMGIASIPNVDDDDDGGPKLNISVEPNTDLIQKICNLFNTNSDHMDLTRIIVKASVCKRISVETLKTNILRLFDPLRTFSQLSLMASIEDDVFLPLLETDSLCNILNKVSFDKIMVSQCKGLEDNEICAFVFASKGQNSKIRGNFKMKLGKKCVLNKQTTVAKNIKTIVSDMDLDRNKTYHLRHISNDKQSGEVIEESDCLLSKAQIEHGCRLLICEGPAISTGFVQIPVWRYPMYPLLNHLQHEIFDLDVAGRLPYENPSFVEYVKINKEDTLYDLKETLSKLDGFKGYEVEEICVRNVYKRLCMKTYTSNTMTIKRMKLGPLTPIAVQQRKSSDIKENTIILNVFFHLPCTRHYCLQHELLWENAQDMASLPACIADMLGNKEITVARYCDDENEWKLLPLIEPNNKKNNNSKRNKSKKTSHSKNKGRNNSASNKKVQSELNEGDIIGVKINERENFDKIPMNDFDREEDITARNLKKNCEPIATTQAIEKPVQKESEASLKIHVDKFE